MSGCTVEGKTLAIIITIKFIGVLLIVEPAIVKLTQLKYS